MRGTVKKAVLFDLGNTLVEYFSKAEQHSMLEQANRRVQARLRENGLLRVSWDVAWERALAENKEASDYHVIPLIERLARIFELDQPLSRRLESDLCRCWLKPVFETARRYPDTLPVLRELRSRGIRTAIVSNTTWGSPGALWREHLRGLELVDEVDEVVFCTDVGWRKPAGRIFEHAMRKLGVSVSDCVFVGDDPRWDIAGPEAIGMDAVLIDRTGLSAGAVRELTELT